MTTDVEAESVRPAPPVAGRRLLGRLWSVLLGLWEPVTGAGGRCRGASAVRRGRAGVPAKGGRVVGLGEEKWPVISCSPHPQHRLDACSLVAGEVRGPDALGAAVGHRIDLGGQVVDAARDVSLQR